MTPGGSFAAFPRPQAPRGRQNGGMNANEFAIRVTPRAHADEIVTERDGVVLVRVRAPPVDDRANLAACRLIAERLGVRPGAVWVVRGGRSRQKVIRVDGMDGEEARRALG